jgi:hypothetical protein
LEACCAFDLVGQYVGSVVGLGNRVVDRGDWGIPFKKIQADYSREEFGLVPLAEQE